MNWDVGNRAAMAAALTALVITGGAFALNHHIEQGTHRVPSPISSIQERTPGRIVAAVDAPSGPITTSSIEPPGAVTASRAVEPAQPVTVSNSPEPRVAVMSLDMTSKAASIASAKVAPAKPFAEKIQEGPAAGMPPEIDGWLKRLYQTENSRRSLASSQIHSLLSEFASLLAGPAAAFKEDGDFDENQANATLQRIYGRAMELRASWAQLDNYLHAVPVPEKCKVIDQPYTESIRQTQAMLQEVATVCLKARENPEAALGSATAMGGTSSGPIDNPALRANSQLQELFKEFGIQPWFDIQGDVGVNLWSR